jgi:hypothetical protein
MPSWKLLCRKVTSYLLDMMAMGCDQLNLVSSVDINQSMCLTEIASRL